MPSDILKNKKLLIGYDPKLFTKKILISLFGKNDFKFKSLKNNLIDQIWKRKVVQSNLNFYPMPKKTSVGENFKSKINKVVLNLKKKGADYQFITASENNAWLLNIRGADAKYAPIPSSYVLIGKNNSVTFFCNNKKSFKLFKKKF